MLNLKGKSVLITGGSRGIGAACVKYFSKADANVAFTYHQNKEAADKVLEEFRNAKSYKVDLSSEDDIIQSIKNIEKDFDGLDVLVNNAGIWKYGSITEMSLKEWEETIKVNLNAVFLYCKYSVPLMKKRGSGKIINIASTAGQRGEAFHSHYAASKGGVISFTKSLASELGKEGINVNCVAPGWVYTDMTNDILEDKDYEKLVREQIPLNKIPSADEIAGPVLFLASDLASHITGEILNVNGGSVLCG